MTSLGLEPQWQGAEAKVYVGEFAGKPAIYKQRFPKTYRHPVLDERLNSRRITQEARCIAKAWKSRIPTPTLYFVDSKAALIVMEKIDGLSVKEAIIQSLMPMEVLGRLLGEIIANLHSADIIHGDLTTSNILLRKDLPVLIDFGLASVSNSAEDRAVDLYVLERAINSTHPECGQQLFHAILSAYGSTVNNAKATLSKLAEVQLRGRKRDMIG